MKKRFCRSLLPTGLALLLALTEAWPLRVSRAEESPLGGGMPVDVAPTPGTWSGATPQLDLPTPHGPDLLLHDNGGFTTGIDDGCGTQSPRNTSQVEVGHLGLGLTGGATPGGSGESFRLADDFVVPNGQLWRPTQLKWYAYQTQTTGSNPPTNTLTGMNVQIWSGTPGAGGSVVAGNPSTIVPLISSTFSGTYRVSSTALTNCQRAIIEMTVDLTQLTPPIPAGGLAPGTYWVDVQCIGSLTPAAGVFCVPTVPSYQGGDQDNARQSSDDGANWLDTTDTGDFFPLALPFKLYGLPTGEKSPSVYTYQGLVKNGGGGLNGSADFRFTVHYSETGDFVAGPPSQVDNVPVNDGLFTANVELPAGILPEFFWWLEIDVRYPAGSGSFVTLSPRQRITTTPRARFADSCNVLSDSAQVSWSQLSGVPSGFADGIDNDSGGDITAVTAGVGLTGGGTAGALSLAVNFAGNGAATTVARSDHAHSSLNASDGSPANALALDVAGNVGIGTATPATKLTIYDSGESTTQTTFTQGLTNAGLHILTDFTVDAFTPGLFWSTTNNNPNKPKAGVYLSETGAGTQMHLGTSNNYATGITHEVIVNEVGNVGIGTASPPHKLTINDTLSGGLTFPVRVENPVSVTGTSTGIAFRVTGTIQPKGAIVYERTAATFGRGTFHFLQDTVGDDNPPDLTNSVMSIANNGNVAMTGALAVAGALSAASGTFSGAISATSANAGIKDFKIDHPLDPENKYLYHSCVESSDRMNVYNGNVVTDAEGYATITLPDWFEALNRDFRYQLTVIDEGDTTDFVQVKIVRRISGNQFTIRSSRGDVEVSWQITGVRQDALAKTHPLAPEVDKEPENKGLYLHPDAFGLPRDRGIPVSRGASSEPADVTPEPSPDGANATLDASEGAE